MGAGAAGLAAAQAFRSQLPQDAAEYVRMNVLPRPGPQPQPPPQINDVERLLDKVGQRAQEVERGAAQAIEETAAVAAEEGEVAVAAEGVGGAFGYLGGLAEGAAGRILYDPHERVEMLHDLEGSEHQRVALLHRQSSAVLRADRAGPDHVKVPRRKQRVVPAPDVAQDRGLKFRYDVQGNDLPPCRLEGSANRLCAAKQLQQSRHV